jgi:hypothetical protein
VVALASRLLSYPPLSYPALPLNYQLARLCLESVLAWPPCTEYLDRND